MGVVLALWGWVASPPRAAALEPAGPVDFKAGVVEADPSRDQVILKDGVVIQYEGYRITGERLRLQSLPSGIEIEGPARISPCPCEQPPVAVRLLGARVEPTGDLYARWPRFELFGLPVLTLPWLWIRPFDRVGLTPPILSWRGDDGLLAGLGLHVPWRGEQGRMRSLELTLSGYFRGGVEASARLQTPSSTARLCWDYLQSSRVVVDAHGSASGGNAWPPQAAVAWDVDFVRGPRGRSATVELAPAAQPFDFGRMETSLGFSAAGGTAALASAGIVARAIRGEGILVAGPGAGVAVGGAVAALGTWEGDLSGVVLGDLGGDRDAQPGRWSSLPVASKAAFWPFVRAALGLELDLRPGPAELMLHARGRMRAASAPAAEASRDAAAGVQAELRLPFVRGYGGRSGELPLLHWLIPVLEARGHIAVTRGPVALPLYRPIAPVSWLGAAGLISALGKPLGSAFRTVLRLGLLGEHGGANDIAAARAPTKAPATLSMAHLRASVNDPRLAAEVQAVAVAPVLRSTPSDPAGVVLAATLRMGPVLGTSMAVDIVGQHGGNSRAARSLTGDWAALPGEQPSYLEQPGWTAGAELAVPWTQELKASVRADADLTAAAVLALGAGLAYRHRSGCLTLGIFGAERVGRKGADVWLSAAVAPQSPSVR